MKKTITGTATVISLALVLSGCATSRTGQDVASAERHLRSLHDVESVEIEMTRDTLGMTITNSNGVLIILYLQDGTQLSSQDIEYVLQTGWSLQSDRKLVRGVSIGVQGSSAYNLGKALDRDRWVEAGRRALVAACAGVLVLIGLSGCVTGGGLAPLEARDALEHTSGVRHATVTTGTVVRSLGNDYFVDVRITVDPKLDQEHLRALAVRAVQTGWATRISHSPYGVDLRVSGAPGIDVSRLLDGNGFDLQGGTAPDDPVLVSAESLRQKWGAWPGQRPVDLG